MSEMLRRMKAGLPLDHVEVIDMHAHAGVYNGMFVPVSTPEAFVEYMDRYGVDISCIASIPAGAPGDNHLLNDRLIAFKRFAPERFRVYVTLNTNYLERMIDEIKRVRAEIDIIGVKMHVYDQMHKLTEPRFVPLLEYLQSEGLILLHHGCGGIPERCADFPDLTFFEGHFVDLDSVARLPNLYVSICGAMGARTITPETLERVPVEKVLFGSDMSVLDIGTALSQVAYADIPEESKEAIVGGNMRRVLQRLGMS